MKKKVLPFDMCILHLDRTIMNNNSTMCLSDPDTFGQNLKDAASGLCFCVTHHVTPSIPVISDDLILFAKKILN